MKVKGLLKEEARDLMTRMAKYTVERDLDEIDSILTKNNNDINHQDRFKENYIYLNDRVRELSLDYFKVLDRIRDLK